MAGRIGHAAGGDWLWTAAWGGGSISPPPVGQVFQTYRATHGMTQAQLAELLSMDQSYVSKVESGQREIRDVGVLLRIARRMAISPAQLGLASDAERSGGRWGHVPHREAAVVASQHEWRLVRRHLNQHRSELASVAARLYPEERRVGCTTLIAGPGWLPPEPVPLADLRLRWREGRQRCAVLGAEPEARLVCPFRSPGNQFSRYTAAIRYLDRPVLFENRPSYRLLDLAWGGGGGELGFSLSTYFEKLDISEAVGHELAAAMMRPATGGDRDDVWARLPFRSLVGDPFDLGRRAVLPAVTTLTLRHCTATSTAAFLLHWRDPDRVATAGGLYDVMPAGEFQPSSIAPEAHVEDFCLWRNLVREFSEELLGTPEHDGSAGTPLDYEGWALYRALTQAREAGDVRVHCLGVGLDALTLAATILTVVVIRDRAFEELFGEVVGTNEEGFAVTTGRQRRVSEGIPFVEENVRRLLTSEPMASPGAACLHLAWEHRSRLLAT